MTPIDLEGVKRIYKIKGRSLGISISFLFKPMNVNFMTFFSIHYKKGLNKTSDDQFPKVNVE